MVVPFAVWEKIFYIKKNILRYLYTTSCLLYAEKPSVLNVVVQISFSSLNGTRACRAQCEE